MSDNILSAIVEKPKGVPKKDFYESRKSDFQTLINSDFFFKEKKVNFLYFEDIDRCYEKFILGGEKEKRTIDLQRIERFHWIGEILKHLRFCSKCSDCSDIYVYLNTNDNRYYVLDESVRYLLVLVENEEDFLLLTAFRLNRDNIEKHISRVVKYGNKR